MAWNEPGGTGKNSDNQNQDPWGGKSNSSPPDLDKIINDFIKKLKSFFTNKKGQLPRYSSNTPPKKELGVMLGFAALILVAFWIISGFFIVNPAEQAVILRLGKYQEVLPPGLHWIARFIDTKYLVDIQKIYSFSLQGDFLTKSAEQGDLPNQVISVDSGRKTVDATGVDRSKNLINVEMNVQYRISDPRAYLFNIVNPDDTIQEVAAGALSDVVGKMKLDEVLTTGRENLSSGVLNRLKQVLLSYRSGLTVVAVSLRKVQAPDQVRAAFNDVNRADQDRATYIQQAQAYASKVVPIAQGNAARILADASGYQQQVVLGAEASVARFQAILKAYTAAPDVTRDRIYLETIQNILKNTSKILIDANSSNNILYLPLEKLLKINEENKILNSNNDNESVATISNGNQSSLPEAKS